MILYFWFSSEKKTHTHLHYVYETFSLIFQTMKHYVHLQKAANMFMAGNFESSLQITNSKTFSKCVIVYIIRYLYYYYCINVSP